MGNSDGVSGGPKTRWLTVYTWIFLPFRILAGFVPVLAQFDRQREAGYQAVLSLQDFAPAIMFGIFTLVVMFGLHRRQLWGWNINWVYLVATVLASPLATTKETGPYMVAVAIWVVLFFWPNYIYFKKRRELFH